VQPFIEEAHTMKKIAIALAAAAMFDLGTVVVSSQAAEGADLFLKIDKPASSQAAGRPGSVDHKMGKVEAIFKFYKIDAVNTPRACMAKGGEVVKNAAGQQACKSDMPIPGGIEVLSWSWGASGAR
jgi:hypothetical protein